MSNSSENSSKTPDDYYYDEYVYPGFAFERPMYLYIWGILVIFTSLVNIFVVVIFLRKDMRNSTSITLAAIAVSDSLTGLVTLPAYFMAFQRFDPVTALEDPNLFGNVSQEIPKELYTPIQSSVLDPVDGYELSKDLCRGLMISKYFLSKMFHTTSILLTVYLAVQRYLPTAYPLTFRNFFSVRKSSVFCIITFLISPAFHAFHLSDEKAMHGQCQWQIDESGCAEGCAYLWIVFLLRHFLPCITLLIISAMFINTLHADSRIAIAVESTAAQTRSEENKKYTIVVIAIVIVFLIPELPYGAYLLYNAISQTYSARPGDLETNRAIHMSYELLLVFSFHANIYVYMFNSRFRETFKRTFISPVNRFVGYQ